MISLQSQDTMTLGMMNKQISLRKTVSAVGQGGRLSETETVIDTVWAAVSSRYHAPIIKAGKVDFPTTINFIAHNKKAYHQANKIVWEDRIFHVLGVIDPDDNGRFIEFRTREDVLKS